MANEGLITDLRNVRPYLLGGHAVFTLVSKRTGERKTFRAREADENDDAGKGRAPALFIDLLVGPQNTEDYKYLAFLWQVPVRGDLEPQLKLKPAKTPWGEEAYRALDWLTHRLNVCRNVVETDEETWAHENQLFNSQAEFWHSGKCSRCGRELTTPESIARGLGPICAEEG